jgi:hypothetical protein
MKRICFVVMAMILATSISYGQDSVDRKVLYPTLSSYVEYRSWEKEFDSGTQTISQFSVPTMFKLPVTRSLAFDVTGSMISSSADENDLSGVGDTKIRAVAMLADDTIMLNAGMNLPSGKSDMDEENINASGLLLDKALGFKYSRLGEGLDVNLACGYAKTYEPIVVGIGAGYLLKGKYSHLEDEDFKYKPGNQLNLTGGFDVQLNPVLLRSDVTYTIYQSDTEDDAEVIKEGTRLSISETVFLPMDRFSIVLSGRYIDRGETEFLSGSFNGEGVKRYGTQVNVNGAITLKMTEVLTLKLLTDSVFIGKNADDQNDATVFGFGAGINVRFMRASYIDIAGRYHTGSSNDGDISLTGLSTTAAIRIMF